MRLRLGCCAGFGGNCFCVVAALDAQPGRDAGFACRRMPAGVLYFVRTTTAALTMAQSNAASNAVRYSSRTPQSLFMARSVANQIGAPGDGQSQIGADLAAAADGLEVPAHPGVVGDDSGVLATVFPSPR